MKRYISVDEMMNDLEGEQANKEGLLDKLDYLWYRVRMFFRYGWKHPHQYVVRSYQRVTRGFSNRDAYNGDSFLAGQLAGIMQWIVDNGQGCQMTYADPLDVEFRDVDGMIERRNAEYVKHIAIFKEYAKSGVTHNAEWQKEFGGVLDKDIEDSLQWLSEHFQELWD